MPEHLPCPFCGSGDVIVGTNETKEDYADIWFAMCGQCGSQGPRCYASDGEFGGIRQIDQKYSARALERWNDR